LREVHGHGVRTLKNFTVNQQGNAESRPGTRLLSACGAADVVLIPFVYSPDVSYVLEFYSAGIRVHHPDTGFTGKTVAFSSWTVDEFREMTWAQSGRFLYLAHQNHRPTVITAPEDPLTGDWEYSSLQFSPPLLDDDTPLEPVFWDGVSVIGQAPVLALPMLMDVPVGSLFLKDSTHPPREWEFRVSTLFRNTSTGETAESTARTVTKYLSHATDPTLATPASLGTRRIVCDPETPVSIWFYSDGVTTASHWTIDSPWQPIAQNVYRGRGAMFGFVGQAFVATPVDASEPGREYLKLKFTDNGDEPNYQRQPLRSTNPFPVTGTQPAALGFYQQRLALGGASGEPATVKLSATDDWANFDEPVGPFIAPDMPLEFTFASSSVENIRQLVALHRLLVMTDSGIWTLGPSDGSDGFSTSAEFKKESDVGCSKLQALRAEGAVLYVPTTGRGVRAIAPGQGGLVFEDASWSAEHIFKGAYSTKTAKSWCYEGEPRGILWCVLSDGSWCSTTRTGQGRWAWSRHFTGGVRHLLPDEAGSEESFEVENSVISACALRRASRTDVFLAVARRGGTYLERMTERDTPTDVYNADSTGGEDFALDSYVLFTDKALRTNAITEYELNGLQHLKGFEVYVVSPGNPTQGPYIVDSAGNVTVQAVRNSNQYNGLACLAVGLKFTCDLELLDVAPGTLNQKTLTRVGFEVKAAPGLEVGEDFDHLTIVRERNVSDGYAVTSAATSVLDVRPKGSWRSTGRAVLRQSNPKPVTVYGVTREIENGG
jgi:hypothetical protein